MTDINHRARLRRRTFLTGAASVGVAGLAAGQWAPQAAAVPSGAADGCAVLYADDEVTVAALSPWRTIDETAAITGPDCDMVQIEAAAGQVAQCQLVIRPTKHWSDVRVTATDLRGRTPVPSEQVRVRSVGRLLVEPPTRGGSGGNVPDLLEALPTMDLAADRNHLVWVTVPVPADGQPGPTIGHLVIHQGGRRVADVTLQLWVRNFALPAQPTVTTVSTLWPTDIEPYDPVAIGQGLAHYHDDFADHRVTGTNTPSQITVIDGDPLRLDTEAYDRFAEHVFDELGFTWGDFPGLNHRDPFNPVILPKVNNPSRFAPGATWNDIPIFVADDSAELTDEFVQTFGGHAAAVAAHLRSRGWLDRCYLKLIDELRTDIALNVERLVSIFTMIKEADPGIRITLTAVPDPGLYPYVDHWMVHSDYWWYGTSVVPDGPERVRHAREAGQTLYIYHNTIAPPDLDRVRIRMFSWLMWKEGIRGSLSWFSTANWHATDDPWALASRTDAQRASNMVYPPRPPAAAGHPLDSVRWELFRQGLQDYEQFLILEQAIADGERRLGASADADLTAAVSEGKAALAEARSLVNGLPHVQLWKDQDTYETDPARYDRVAARTADAIEALRKAVG